MNICFRCGAFRADKIIDPDGPYAICPECNYKHPFLQLPLLIVSGASGTGKSTICRAMTGTVQLAVLLDSDILWREEFDRPQTSYRAYFEMWLRLCKNISQSGRPVVLFGAGMGVPENMEPCVERRYFSELHYLALTCEDEVLADRLRRRPKWRESGEEVHIAEHVSFNRWFKDNGHRTDPPVTLLDTTEVPIQDADDQVAAWMRERIDAASEQGDLV